MKARYVRKTSLGKVTTIADVMLSVDEVKERAAQERKTPIIEVLEELPVGAPTGDEQEYSVPLVARFKSAPLVKSKQVQRKPKLEVSGVRRVHRGR